jgi:23S rRNA pseudouridine955/2504/2580 synthase
MIEFDIKTNSEEITVVSFLKKRFKKSPLSLIYKLFRKKKIEINGEEIRYYHRRLRIGEKLTVKDGKIEVYKVPEKNLTPRKSRLEFEVVFEDSNLLIVVKNHGITMPELDKTVRSYLFLKNKVSYEKLVSNFFVFSPVHRLDRLTKGLLIYPKNARSKENLYNAISNKGIVEKSYLAICESTQRSIDIPERIEGYIYKCEERQRMFFSRNANNNYKKCSMKVKIIGESGSRVYFLVILETGRKHQIRTILSHFGFPIVGDTKYGLKNKNVINRMGLFAFRIKFIRMKNFLSYLNEKTVQMNFSSEDYFFFPKKIEERLKLLK